MPSTQVEERGEAFGVNPFSPLMRTNPEKQFTNNTHTTQPTMTTQTTANTPAPAKPPVPPSADETSYLPVSEPLFGPLGRAKRSEGTSCATTVKSNFLAMRLMILFILMAGLCRPALSAEAMDMAKRAKEVQQLHFGMFVCWSFSTFSGREHSRGEADISLFKATKMDTDQWARTAKEAGMTHILFLAKHHDGFCLWDTATTDRKVTKAPLGQDVLAAVRKSCDKYGLKLALYFSEGDWSWPGPNTGRFGLDGQSGHDPDKLKAQLKDLLTNYGPIEYFWMDCAGGHAGLDHRELNAWVKSHQPGCLVGCNSGIPGDGSDMRAGERTRPSRVKGFLVGEFTYPIQPQAPKGAQWFYSHPDNEHLCETPESIYKDYLSAVKYDLVFDLNVGPDYEGKLRAIDVDVLRKVGNLIKNPPPPEAPPLSLGKTATASSSWSAEYGPNMAMDWYEDTRWSAAANARDGWLEVDLGAISTIGRVVIIQSHDRIREYTVEWQDGKTWKELARGTTIEIGWNNTNGEKTIDFTPVKTRRVRLNILKATEEPSIADFLIFAPVTK
jgi:alpha-L-fucosidase